MHITDLTLIFTIVLLLIWLAPIAAKWFRLPTVVVLLAAGIALGGHGLGMLEYDQSFRMLGRIGMLYIMFLSAVEMDLEGFRQSRGKSLVFGLMTFLLPVIFGLVSSRLLGMDWQSSLLLATVYAAHTLLTYPIVSRNGLARHRIVSIAVGGTILAVTLALLMLTVTTAADLKTGGFLRYMVFLPLYLVLVFAAIPYVTRWYLKRGPDPMLQVVYMLAIALLSSYLADQVGLQSILGAFFAGLALNKFVPQSSPLMNRISFLGNTLFIPFFLIGIGMQVNLNVFAEGYTAFLLAAVMILVSLGSKWLAAWLTARMTHLYKSEAWMLFGMSGAKAAATLAVISIGQQITSENGTPLLDQNVVSAAIILILVSCIVSAVVTDRTAKKIVAQRQKHVNINADQQIMLRLTQHGAEPLTLLAVMLNRLSPQHPLLAFTAAQGSAATDIMNTAKKITDPVDERLVWEKLQPSDMNIASVMRRQGVSTYMIPAEDTLHSNKIRWNDEFAEVLGATPRQIIVYKAVQPLNTIRRILVAVPRYADREAGFAAWLGQIFHISTELSAKLIIYTNSILKAQIRKIVGEQSVQLKITYRELSDWEDMLLIARDRKENDMSVIILSRVNCVSYHPLMQRMPDLLSRFFSQQQTMIVFPEQQANSSSGIPGLFAL